MYLIYITAIFTESMLEEISGVEKWTMVIHAFSMPANSIYLDAKQTVGIKKSGKTVNSSK